MVDPSATPCETICTEEEVLHLLLVKDTSKTSGPGGISGKMLKNIALSIFPALTKLFNLSVSTGKIPHKWIVSSIVPIPKSSSNTENLNESKKSGVISMHKKQRNNYVEALTPRGGRQMPPPLPRTPLTGERDGLVIAHGPLPR